MARGLGGTWSGAVVVGSVTAIALTLDHLPARVASHFDGAGLANGYSTRFEYAALLIGLTVLLGVLPAALIGILARRSPELINVPNLAYWLEPERRAAAIRFLDQFANWLAAGSASFMVAVHFLLLRANAVSPPRLENRPFVALLIAFAVLLLAGIRALHRRFRLPG